MKRILCLLTISALAVTLFGCVGCGTMSGKESENLKKEAAALPTQLLCLKIQGATYAQLTEFKSRLSSVRGVKNIYQTSFSKEEASSMQVEYAGTSQMLADAIQNLKLEKIAVEVEKFDATGIDLKME